MSLATYADVVEEMCEYEGRLSLAEIADVMSACHATLDGTPMQLLPERLGQLARARLDSAAAKGSPS
jgi:hypothetical protein